jgi:hypothetical protein
MSQKEKRTPPTPTISRVFPDGSMIEALYQADAGTTSLAVRTPDGKVDVLPHVDLPSGERLVPYSPLNNLLTSGCVLLPGDVGDFGDKGDLRDDIRSFIHRYVDLDPLFEEIAAHYVLLSWVYDAFSELPYLRFRGDYGTGKTRALLTIGSISYKPFFASGASTVSPIFHVLDSFGGTMVLDEADFRFSDATAELTKILNNGNMEGLPVLRTITNRHKELNPTAFKVYGPKIVGMREGFADRALESRFLTYETGGRPLRSDISIGLPRALKAEALLLRNKLLAWRFDARHTVAPDPSRLIDGVEPRVNQTALALLSIIDDEGLRSRVRDELLGEEARVIDERASSLEATMLGVLVDAFLRTEKPHVSIKEIAGAFNQASTAELTVPMTNKSVGTFLRNRLHLKSTKTRGVYVVPQTERTRVMALAQRHGVIAKENTELEES